VTWIWGTGFQQITRLALRVGIIRASRDCNMPCWRIETIHKRKSGGVLRILFFILAHGCVSPKIDARGSSEGEDISST
jgi:hypothetical protein